MTSKILEEVLVEAGGFPRRALIYVPDRKPAGRLPVVLAFHGGDGKPEQMDKLTGFDDLAQREGFAVVYPEGINRRWNHSRKTDGELHDDASFIAVLIDRLEEINELDTDQVFAVGISNGGFFAQYLAINGERRINAVASVAATLSEDMHDNLVPPRPVPVLFILGVDDPVVPFNGGAVGIGRRKRGKVVSAAAAADYWTRANRSVQNPEITELARISDEDETRVVKSIWPATVDGAEVIVYRVEGGGHTWPMGWQFYRERYIGVTSRQLNATGVIWEFFKQHLR